MEKDWIYYVGIGGFIAALSFTAIGIGFESQGLMNRFAPCAQMLVGYSIGFFGAWFVQKCCDFIKHPCTTAKSIFNSLGPKKGDKAVLLVLVPMVLFFGVISTFGPIFGNAAKTTLLAIFFGATLYSEFFSPILRAPKLTKL